MSLDHAYTNEALSKLIEATNAIANEVDMTFRTLQKRQRNMQNDLSDPLKQHMRITLERPMLS
jgi:hypothetical protein